jgi:hypothetical protein
MGTRSQGRRAGRGGGGRGSSLLLVVTVLALALIAPAVSEGAEGPSYVSLGDSYTAGPGIAPQTGVPECGQSAANYPHLVAVDLSLALTDVSCSGANTLNMINAQYPDQPPQFDALSPTTEIVTLSIGGNDNNFYSSTVSTCTFIDSELVGEVGAPCKKHYGHSTANEIIADGALIGEAIHQIHVHSPSAKVFVIGYPDLLPKQGNCFASLPWTSGDYHFWDGLERKLNSVFKSRAKSNGAIYVDTYTGSVGHDICQPVGLRWMEPLYGGGGAALHPNGLGEAHQAVAVEQAMTKAGIR